MLVISAPVEKLRSRSVGGAVVVVVAAGDVVVGVVVVCLWWSLIATAQLVVRGCVCVCASVLYT